MMMCNDYVVPGSHVQIVCILRIKMNHKLCAEMCVYFMVLKRGNTLNSRTETIR